MAGLVAVLDRAPAVEFPWPPLLVLSCRLPRPAWFCPFQLSPASFLGTGKPGGSLPTHALLLTTTMLSLFLVRPGGHPEVYGCAGAPLSISLEPVNRVPQYPRCITLEAGVSFLYPVNWPWHKIPKLCYCGTVPAGTEVTRAPHHLRNSTCLAHGRSHGSFPVGAQRAIKEVPPLDNHTLLDLFLPFYTTSNIRRHKPIVKAKKTPQPHCVPCSLPVKTPISTIPPKTPREIPGPRDWRDVGIEVLRCRSRECAPASKPASLCHHRRSISCSTIQPG